jgi:Omp85 superfamily domain
MRTPTALRRRACLVIGACAVLPAAASAQAPADSASDSVTRRRIQPLPAVGSAPETGLQFGATVLAVWAPPASQRTRPATVVASALRTAKSQTRLRLDAERWWRGNTRRVAAMVQWQEFPLPYFGIGDRTPASAEEVYTPVGTEASVTVQQRLGGALYLLGAVRHLDQRITSDSGGALATSGVHGARGATITEFTSGVIADTRDNLFAPRRGHLLQATYARSAAGLWSDYSYGTARVDARVFRTVAATHVLAMQVQGVAVDGQAPFDQLALVGSGEILRGYARGRFRDRVLLAGQGEYRSPFLHRVGGVVFGGAGIVAPSVTTLDARRVLPTYGAGLRVLLDERQRTGFRVDYGRGREGASGLYIGFHNAF